MAGHFMTTGRFTSRWYPLPRRTRLRSILVSVPRAGSRRLLRSAPTRRPSAPGADQRGERDFRPPSQPASIYAGQFGSYTTLLWQVPALSLTAQSFLLTIALMKESSNWARIVACSLSMLIALASVALMHNQRGRAINHAELLRRLSEKLRLNDLLEGNMELDDAVPKKTNAQSVWAVDHLIYHGWKWCMILFAVADVLIVVVDRVRPSLLG